MRVDSVSLRSTRQRQNDLRDQIHREFVNRPFQFNERSQLFVGTHNETLSVTMRANDPNCAPVIVERGRPAHAESGLDDFVNDDHLLLCVPRNRNAPLD